MTNTNRLAAYLLFGSTLSCLSGCSLEKNPNIKSTSIEYDEKINEKNLAQIESLHFIYYSESPVPLKPSAKEIRNIESRLALASSSELAILSKIFAGIAVLTDQFERDDLLTALLDHINPLQRELLAYALRDSDHDGVFDYRISSFGGKFYEGDLDVDDDGIGNVYDPNPYKKETESSWRDSNGDLIPEDSKGLNFIPVHLKWNTAVKSNYLVSLQEKLFQMHKVILLERLPSGTDMAFDDKLGRSIEDNLNIILKSIFSQTKDGVLPSLRQIILEDLVYLKTLEDDQTYAMMISQTSSLFIFRNGYNVKPLVQLGLLTHEFMHAWQYDLDWSGDRNLENARFNYPSPKFLDFMGDFGWEEIGSKRLYGVDSYRIFEPMYLDEDSRQYSYADVNGGRISTEEWAKRLESSRQKHQNKNTDFAYSFDDRTITENFIVGDYSMSNPWEYHADHALSFVIDQLEKTHLDLVCKNCNETQLRERKEKIFEKVWQEWPNFNYRNSEGSPIYKFFKRWLSISDQDKTKLAKSYFAEDT